MSTPSKEQPDRGENEPESKSEEGSLVPTDPIATAPPVPGGQNINVLGLNLQRAPLESLPPDVQMRMIELSDTLDQRQHDYYCQKLEKEAEYRGKDLEDRGAARKQALLTFGLLGGSVLIFLGVILFLLLGKDQFEVTQIVLISSLTFFAGLFGGTGLPGLLKQFSD